MGKLCAAFLSGGYFAHIDGYGYFVILISVPVQVQY